MTGRGVAARGPSLTDRVRSNGPEALSGIDGDVSFGYWHIIPAVRHHQHIKRHQLVGHSAAPWLHGHFAERRSGVYRDPLQPAR